MRLEIGGGDRPRPADGDPWINVDLTPGADVVHDLNVTPWPFPDESVDELYSSHCIEHVNCAISFLREVARICKVGALVEIRCPDACSEMAMVHGHRGVVSLNCMRHADTVFPELFWVGERRLSLIDVEIGGDDYWFPKARESHLFKDWTDEEIMTWIPRTRHENRFKFRVSRVETGLKPL